MRWLYDFESRTFGLNNSISLAGRTVGGPVPLEHPDDGAEGEHHHEGRPAEGGHHLQHHPRQVDPALAGRGRVGGRDGLPSARQGRHLPLGRRRPRRVGRRDPHGVQGGGGQAADRVGPVSGGDVVGHEGVEGLALLPVLDDDVGDITAAVVEQGEVDGDEGLVSHDEVGVPLQDRG